ncbi:MAG: diaminopimelate epimerase [Actinomycetota bacterium]|jgi:diaminopimelate epimerase
MNFAKYQGTGNDFVMIADPDDSLALTAELARSLCDRRFGIGADGVIRVAPSHEADFLMDYLNADGSASEMCGNGIRCVAVFARAEGLTQSHGLSVATGAGTKTVVVGEDGRVRVDMGPPIFEPSRIPVLTDGAHALHTKLDLGGEVFEAAVLSMGNPHAVLFVDDSGAAPVRELGPRLEQHSLFPNHANIEFAVVESDDRIRMRVWERGSGETMACGTGACAGVVAARLLHGGDWRATVVLPGGEVEVEWSGSLDSAAPVFMTGDALEVFRGEIAV